MSLMDRVYSHQLDERFWEKYPWTKPPFGFFNPKISYLGLSPVKKAIKNGDNQFFINQIRNNFLPDKNDLEVQERLRQAANRGIQDLNTICTKYLKEDAHHFIIPEIKPPLDLFQTIKSAREEWITARSGKHNNPNTKRPIDSKLFFEAYQKVRSFGIGYWVFMIETAPPTLDYMRSYGRIVDWFNNHFGFRNPQQTQVEDLPVSWETNADVMVYGTPEKPLRSRLKILDGEKLKYSSLLMKMFLEGNYMDRISDYAGLEFIVKDEEDRDKLLRHFYKIKVTGMLEKFKGPGDTGKRSKHSSPHFNCAKFIFRPPIAVSDASPCIHTAYERIPAEIQILTLQGHEQRKNNPDIEHEEYKRRQFKEVFPIWYPKEIYNPILS